MKQLLFPFFPRNHFRSSSLEGGPWLIQNYLEKLFVTVSGF